MLLNALYPFRANLLNRKTRNSLILILFISIQSVKKYRCKDRKNAGSMHGVYGLLTGVFPPPLPHLCANEYIYALKKEADASIEGR
jgi:hypothetical protein